MVASQNIPKAPTSPALPVASVVPLNGSWMADGDKYFKERQYKNALNCYSQAVAADPLSVNAWYNKAQAQVMCLKYLEAIETCSKTLELDSKHASTYFLKSFAHGVLGQYLEALEAATNGLEIDPSNNMVWSTRGQYLYALGRLEEALESFGTALKMSPDNAYFQEVTAKIKKWLQRDGQSPEWAEQVLSFLKRGGFADAVVAYQESMKVDPRAVTKTFDKDYALAHMSNPEKMMKDFENTKSKDQPQIQLELSQKEYEFSREAWVEVLLTNKGKTAARDLVFTFSQDVTLKQLDISPEQVAMLKSGRKALNLDAIPDLPPGGKFKKLVSLTPAKLGQIALEATLNYTDAWGLKQTRTIVVWISVFKPGGQLPAIPGHKMLWRLSSSESANIYVAQRTSDSIRVVVKIPAFTAEQTSQSSEFMNELKQTSKLIHPNIVKVHQFGEQPTAWMTMEYMSKGTLTRRIEHLAVRDALKIAILIADALYYGRMNRLAHCWVTPDNIFFDDQDIPKLANWRIGSITQKLHKSNNISEIVTAYYPPEKISSGLGGLDFFSDIYQLGAILFEMLTGKPIFSETGVALINKIKSGHPHNASLLNSNVSRELDTVIANCLAKNKKDRYQSTAALKTDLLKILAAYNSTK
jgi:tetratricopeptide (TPR) repeat protein